VGKAKLLVQSARGLTDDRDVPAHGIHNQGIGRPVCASGRRLLGDAPAAIPDVHHVDERVIGGHARYRGTASASTLSRILG
jgi:hypothetical protein